MRTEATWRCWLPIEPLGLAAAVLPLPVLLPAVAPVAPLPRVEPELLGEPVAPVPVEPDAAEVSEPVTSTWCPLCCASSVARPCRTYVEPPMAMLPAAPLPAVPAVEPPVPLVEPVEPAPEVDPAPLVEPRLPVLPMLDAAAVRAFVSMKLPLPIARDVLDGAPAVPLVPVAPGVLPLP